jgi:hypothetical protein
MVNSKDIAGSHNKTCLYISLRILLCSAVILAVLLYKPQSALSRLAPIDPRDPYIRTKVTLDVGFGYTYHSNISNHIQTSSDSTFTQNYALRTSGNIIDPRLIIYNTFVRYRTGWASGGTTRDALSLGFTTTVLRKFRYPVTFHESRSYARKAVHDTFGLRTHLRFRRLPVTNFSATWSRAETEDDTTLDANYVVIMTKDIGPTKNSLNYSATRPDDGSKVSSWTLSNSIKLSQTTGIHNNMSYRDKFASSGNTSKSYGLTSSLKSKTSNRFTQSHSYSAYMSKNTSNISTSEVSAQSYSGGMGYKLSAKTSLGGGLSVGEASSESQSTNFESEHMSVSIGLGHSIAKNLSLSTSSAYRRSETNIISGLGKNAGSESFYTGAGISYSRLIRNMSFTSTYGFGYQETLSLPDKGGGTGLSQRISLALSNITYKKFSINTGGGFSRVDNLSGNLWSKSKSFRASLTPGYFVKYVTMAGSYNFSSSDSWQSYQDSIYHNMFFSATSRTYKKTRGSAIQSVRVTKGGSIGSIYSYAYRTSLSMSHTRTFKGGKLNLSASYSRNRTESGNSLTRNALFRSNAGYRRSLLRRINWTANTGFLRSRDLEGGDVSNTFYLTNHIILRMRAWLINASQTRTTSYSTFASTRTQDKIMVKISRRFSRRF